MSAGKIHLSLYEKYYIIAHNVCNEVHVYIRKKGKKSVSMKKLFEKWNSISLILRIVCGLVIGVILGLVVPQATGIAILGDVFVGALKAIAPLLVFFLLISALCHAGKSHGGIIKTVIIMYMFSTFLAALVAVIASRLFPVTLTLADAATDMAAPDGIVEVLKTLLMNMVANPVSSLLNANYIGVLTWGVIIGVGMRAANDTTKKVLDDISNGLSQVVSLDHQYGSLRNLRSCIQLHFFQRTGDLLRIRKTSVSTGRFHAVYLLCDQPDHRVLVYPQEPVPADLQVPEEECHYCVLHQKLRSQYSCEYEGL